MKLKRKKEMDDNCNAYVKVMRTRRRRRKRKRTTRRKTKRKEGRRWVMGNKWKGRCGAFECNVASQG